MVEIVERDFAAFFDVPFRVYGPREPHVPPMKSDLRRLLTAGVNPLFPDDAAFSYFTAHRAGRPVGRIVAHAHPASNRRYDTNRAAFGFFDVADDAEAAGALLGHAEDWARARGFTELAGNFNLTAMQQMGVQTGGFERVGYTDMVQNPAHVPRFLEANGFAATFPMTTFELSLDAARLPQASLPPGAAFAPITKATFASRMEDARAVLNDGFDRNPMFVPLTEAEFTFQAGEMTKILDPRLSSVLKVDGQPAGVVICIPDLNGLLRATRSRIGLLTPLHYLRFRLLRRRAVIVFYSVSQAHHGRGLMAGMLARTLTELRAAGYERLGITWIADVNAASLRMMEKIGAAPLHRLHLFAKDLQ